MELNALDGSIVESHQVISILPLCRTDTRWRHVDHDCYCVWCRTSSVYKITLCENTAVSLILRCR